ncbi:MAG TPA: hypothetical protein VH643_24320 [Gemmataceae bacterium]
MHSAAWMKLLRHVPAEEQSKLMLVTSGGTEIAIQAVLRIDPECLALRGRLAGSTEAGRVFFVPYARIDYLGFQQPLKESEFHELFGNLEMLERTTQPTAPAPATPAATDQVVSKGTPAPPSRNPGTIKSTVLEKFRLRSSNPGTQIRPPLDE